VRVRVRVRVRVVRILYFIIILFSPKIELPIIATHCVVLLQIRKFTTE